MKIWNIESITINPYHKTAFKIARVSREIENHRAMVQLIGQTKRIIKHDPKSHQVNNQPVNESQINKAESILLNPKKRIIEELLFHATESQPINHVTKSYSDIKKLLNINKDSNFLLQNTQFLKSFGKYFATRFVEEKQLPHLSFGALEMRIVPPFGNIDD